MNSEFFRPLKIESFSSFVKWIASVYETLLTLPKYKSGQTLFMRINLLFYTFPINFHPKQDGQWVSTHYMKYFTPVFEVGPSRQQILNWKRLQQRGESLVIKREVRLCKVCHLWTMRYARCPWRGFLLRPPTLSTSAAASAAHVPFPPLM